MRYSAIRNQIQSGDLLSWSHRGWGSLYDLQIQAIRVVDRTEYTHVGVAWVVAGRVFVIEAVSAGVRLFPLSRLLPFYWQPAGAIWTERAEAFALSHIGDPYSKLQAVRAFFGALKIGADRTWECAELALEILKACGVNLGHRAVPSDLVREAQRLGMPLFYIDEE